MITVYSKPDCPYCVRAKNWLTTHNVPFTMVDVTKDAESLHFLKVIKGHKTVPQLYIGEELLVEGGFDGLKKLNPDEVRARILKD